MAKAKSPFGDPTEKIDEYTYLIKQDITLVQQKVNTLILRCWPSSDKEGRSFGRSTFWFSTRKAARPKRAQHFKQRSTLYDQKVRRSLGRTHHCKSTPIPFSSLKNLKSQQARKEKITGSRRAASTPSPVFQPAFDMFDGFVHSMRIQSDYYLGIAHLRRRQATWPFLCSFMPIITTTLFWRELTKCRYKISHLVMYLPLTGYSTPDFGGVWNIHAIGWPCT